MNITSITFENVKSLATAWQSDIEQSISDSYHRYGNLGLHALKEKES